MSGGDAPDVAAMLADAKRVAESNTTVAAPPVRRGLRHTAAGDAVWTLASLAPFLAFVVFVALLGTATGFF